MHKLKFQDILNGQIVRSRVGIDLFDPRGVWIVEHLRNGKVIEKFEKRNTVVNEGKNHILGVEFAAVTPVTTWYMGLIDNTAFTTIAATDVMNSHAGWTEFTTYSQAARPQWTAGSASAQSITNAAPVVFDITGTGTLKGAFIASAATKGGTGGILWCGVTYTATVAVANGDQIKNTYTITT